MTCNHPVGRDGVWVPCGCPTEGWVIRPAHTGDEAFAHRACAQHADRLDEPLQSHTVTDTGERPLTTNRVMGLHRQAWAKHTRVVRERWYWLAKKARVPAFAKATITVTPLHKDRRSPQDVAACAPEAKAAIDGIVDAGVLPGDDPRYLLAVTFTHPDVCGHNGMRLTIEEAA